MLSISAADLAQEHGDRYFAAQRVRQRLVSSLHQGAASSAAGAAESLRRALGAADSFRLPELEQALRIFGVPFSHLDTYSVLGHHWSSQLGGVPTDEFVTSVLGERPLTPRATQPASPRQRPLTPNAAQPASPRQSPPRLWPAPFASAASPGAGASVLRVQSTDLSHLTTSMAELRTQPPPAPYATWSDEFLGTPQRSAAHAPPRGDLFSRPATAPSPASRAAGYSPLRSLSAAEVLVSGALRSSAKHAALDRGWKSPPGFLPSESAYGKTSIAAAFGQAADEQTAASTVYRATTARRRAPPSPPPYATLTHEQMEAARHDLPKHAPQLEPAGRRLAAPDVDESLLPFSATWMGPRPTSRRGCMRPQTASIVQENGSYTAY